MVLVNTASARRLVAGIAYEPGISPEPLLNGDSDTLMAIISGVPTREWNKNPLPPDQMAATRDYVNGLYMVRNGLVRVSVRENAGQRTVSYLTPGQSYGFDELAARWQGATNANMQHTLRAVGYVNIVLVPAPAVDFTTSHVDRKRSNSKRLSVLQKV